MPAKKLADELESYCHRHIGYFKSNLYRIFFYDCEPLGIKVQHPKTKQQIDLAKSSLFTFKKEFLDALKTKRKFALRLGKLQIDRDDKYIIDPSLTKKLCSGILTLDSLTEADFKLNTRQKGVDMKIGIDFVLDPMGNHISADLSEHVDGLFTPDRTQQVK